MMDVTVEIEGDIGTLEEALRRFTSTETLDGVNKYQCSRLADLSMSQTSWQICFGIIVIFRVLPSVIILLLIWLFLLYLDCYQCLFH